MIAKHSLFIFVVGCAPAKSIVYYDNSFQDNADCQNEKYNTKYGIYKPNCGLRNVTMSWGHDEYLFQVLKNHAGCTLPDEGLYRMLEIMVSI